MDNLAHWTGRKIEDVFIPARLKQQRGGRVPTLKEKYCRRVLHGSKLKKKKRNVEVAAFAPLTRGRKKKKKKKSRRVVTTAAAAPMTTTAPMLRSPVMTRSRRRGIM